MTTPRGPELDAEMAGATGRFRPPRVTLTLGGVDHVMTIGDAIRVGRDLVVSLHAAFEVLQVRRRAEERTGREYGGEELARHARLAALELVAEAAEECLDVHDRVWGRRRDDAPDVAKLRSSLKALRGTR